MPGKPTVGALREPGRPAHAETARCRVLHADGAGATWTPVITGLDPAGDGVPRLTTRAFPALMAVSGGQLHRSADDCAHWARVTITAPA